MNLDRFERYDIISGVTYAFWVLFGLASVFIPEQFRELADAVCGNMSPLCPFSEFYQDERALSQWGYGDYAIGFSALRDMIFIIFCLSMIIFSVSEYFNLKRRRIDKMSKLKFVFYAAFLAFFTWFFLLNRDFYGVHDGDFSGVLRPFYGSLILSAGVSFVAAVWVGIVATFLFFENCLGRILW